MATTAAQSKSLDEVILDLKNGCNPTINFGWIFERYYAMVYRHFKRNGILPEDCLDLAQEVFLAIYSSIRDLRDAGHFRGWLFSISRNTLRNEIKRRRAQKRLGLHPFGRSRSDREESLDIEALPDRSGSDILTAIVEQQRLERLAAVLKKLPIQMRRCIELRLVEGCSYREIAAVMGISINTVKAHLHQAKKTLKNALICAPAA